MRKILRAIFMTMIAGSALAAVNAPFYTIDGRFMYSNGVVYVDGVKLATTTEVGVVHGNVITVSNMLVALQGQVTTNLDNQNSSNRIFEIRIGSNEAFQISQGNTNALFELRISTLEGSVALSMTNFTPVASSSNYLIYDTTTRTLSGCVTNGGTGGTGLNTNTSYYYANGTTQYFDGSSSITVVLKDSGQQIVNSGSIIAPFSNVKISNTNAFVIDLGNPQIEVTGVAEGTIVVIKGSPATQGVRFINGNGLSLSCGLDFLMGANDVLEVMLQNGSWVELLRQDK